MYDLEKELDLITTGKVSFRERIPADMKKKVRHRAKNTCEYRGCKEKEFLEFHHKNMRNNDNKLSNIQLLCPKHHRKRHSEKVRKVTGYNLVTGKKTTRLVKKSNKKKTSTKKKKKKSDDPFDINLPKPPKFDF